MNSEIKKLCYYNSVDPNLVTNIIGEDEDGYIRVVVGNLIYRLVQLHKQYSPKLPKVVGIYTVEPVVEEIVEEKKVNTKSVDIITEPDAKTTTAVVTASEKRPNTDTKK